MATIVIMPRQGQSVESCVITSWNKKVGDTVAEGDVLFSYETDKSSFDEPAKVSGTLLTIFAEEGADVPCLDPVCAIGEPGEKVEAPAKEGAAAPAAEAPKAKEPTDDIKPVENVGTAVPVVAVSQSGEMKISPRARHLAEKTEADLSKAVPTGPNGRIIERDVNALLDKGLVIKSEPAAAAAAPAPAPEAPKAAEPEYNDVKLPNIRKVIAKSMHASLANMAQLTLNSSFDATAVNAYRASVKANAEKLGLENLTLNDMVLFAVAKTLKNHPDLNANYLDEQGVMRYFTHVNLGVAVDTPRGLLVPTLFNADTMSLNELSRAAKKLIKEAQAGTISPDLLKGGSFTVTNLGSLGVESFTPVINPPQTGILGVDTLMRRVKEVDGKDVFYTAMGLSLTFDHRALDGAPAAKFLKELCANLENFDMLLAL